MNTSEWTAREQKPTDVVTVCYRGSLPAIHIQYAEFRDGTRIYPLNDGLTWTTGPLPTPT